MQAAQNCSLWCPSPQHWSARRKTPRCQLASVLQAQRRAADHTISLEISLGWTTQTLKTNKYCTQENGLKSPNSQRGGEPRANRRIDQKNNSQHSAKAKPRDLVPIQVPIQVPIPSPILRSGTLKLDQAPPLDTSDCVELPLASAQ